MFSSRIPSLDSDDRLPEKFLPEGLSLDDISSSYVGAMILSGTGIDATGAVDSTTAIQAKIDAAAAAGRLLYIPEGTYRCDSQLKFPSNTNIMGAGSQSVLYFNWTLASGGGGATYVINSDTVNGNSNIRLRDVCFKGAGTGLPYGTATTPASGVLMRNVTDYSVSGCRFYRIPGASLATQGVTRARFINNMVLEGGRGGIIVWGYGSRSVHDVSIVGNTVHSVGDDAIGVQANAPGQSAADQGSGITITGNTITGSLVTVATANLGGRGVIVLGCSDVTISSNTISDTCASGILLQGDIVNGVYRARNIVISGNAIRRCGSPQSVQTITASGMYLQEVDYLTVTGNSVADSLQHGILLISATNFVIGNNVLHDNGRTNADFGIRLNGASPALDVNRGVVEGNLVVRSAAAGISAINTDLIKIVGNTTLDNGLYGDSSNRNYSGVVLETVGAATVTGNTMTDTQTTKTQPYGFSSKSTCSSLVLADNSMMGNLLGATNITAPTVYVKRGNLESSTASANYDQDVSGVRRYSHTATPEGAITAPPGSICQTTTGSLYVKATGTGNTGWSALS